MSGSPSGDSSLVIPSEDSFIPSEARDLSFSIDSPASE
jgi:hypothetical protein